MGTLTPGYYLFAGRQNNQIYGPNPSTDRGLFFPLFRSQPNIVNPPTMAWPAGLGNALGGTKGVVDSALWVSEHAIWRFTNEGHLCSWDFATRIFWYVQSDTMVLTRLKSSAASLTIQGDAARSGRIIRDNSNGKYLDWISEYPPAPSTTPRTTYGFRWYSSLQPGVDDAWTIMRLPGLAGRVGVDPCYSLERAGLYAGDGTCGVFGSMNSRGRLVNRTTATILDADGFLTSGGAVSLGVNWQNSVSLALDTATMRFALTPRTSAATAAPSQIFFFDNDTGVLSCQPSSQARTTYVLRTSMTPDNWDPSAEIPPYDTSFALLSCDPYDQAPPSACSSGAPPNPPPDREYKRFRLWAVDSESNSNFGNGLYLIQDNDTGLCLNIEDMKWYPLSVFYTRNRWLTGERSPSGNPLETPRYIGDQTEARFYAPPLVNPATYTIGTSLCNTTPLVTSAPETNRTDCCAGKHLRIESSPVRFITGNQAYISFSYNLSNASSIVVIQSGDTRSNVTKDPIVEEDNLWVQFSVPAGTWYQRILQGKALRQAPNMQWIGYVAPPYRNGLEKVVPELAAKSNNGTGSLLANIVQLKISNDGNKCHPDWCPFGQGCLGYSSSTDQGSRGQEQLANYCGSANSNYLPRFKSETNCQRWCQEDPLSLVGSSRCATQTAVQFCEEYPDSPACLCKNYENTPAFQSIRSAFEAIPGLPTSEVIPEPICWAAPCTLNQFQPDGPVFTSRMLQAKARCPEVTLTFCNQIIEIVNAQGNVNISNNDFRQVCGRDLPGSGGGGGGGGGGINALDRQWIEDNSAIFAVLLLAVIAAFAGVVVLGVKLVSK